MTEQAEPRSSMARLALDLVAGMAAAVVGVGLVSAQLWPMLLPLGGSALGVTGMLTIARNPLTRVRRSVAIGQTVLGVLIVGTWAYAILFVD